MNIKKHIYLVLVVLFAFGCLNSSFSQTAPSPPHVFQSWNEIQLNVPLVRSKDAKGKSFNRVSAIFSGILRVGRSSVDSVDQRLGVTLDFRVNKHVSLLAGVLNRRDEVVKNVPHSETRLGLGAVFSATWHDFTFKDRNLYEHRFRNGRVNTDFYRQRIQISHPVRHKGKVLFSPFISEEGYYEIGARRWVQNEFYAGITRRINSQTAIDIAYIRNDSKPANVNGLSLTLKIALK